MPSVLSYKETIPMNSDATVPYTFNSDGTVTLRPARLTEQQASAMQHAINRHLDGLASARANEMMEKLKKWVAYPADKREWYKEAYYAMFHAQIEGEL